MVRMEKKHQINSFFYPAHPAHPAHSAHSAHSAHPAHPAHPVLIYPVQM